MDFYTVFANTAANAEKSSGGIFEVLGIDWKILILQTIAFGILVFILAKWIYPPILAMLDRRDKLINDSIKAAKEASERSEQASKEIEDQLKKARDQADDIVTAAQDQSSQMLIDGEKDAERRAESVVAAARAQLDRDVQAARKVLRDETASLVALATEKVVGEKINGSSDAKIIDKAIVDASKSKKEAK